MSGTCIRLGAVDALQLEVLLGAGVHVWDASLQRQLPGTFPRYEPPQRRHQHPEVGGLQGQGASGRLAGTRISAVIAEAGRGGQQPLAAAEQNAKGQLAGLHAAGRCGSPAV